MRPPDRGTALKTGRGLAAAERGVLLSVIKMLTMAEAE